MKKQRGFTIIEVLVVFSIIAILSTIGIASFASYSKTQQMNETANDLKLMIHQARFNALNGVKRNKSYNGAIIPCSNNFRGYIISVGANYVDLIQDCQQTPTEPNIVKKYTLPKKGTEQLVSFAPLSPQFTNCTQISFDVLSATPTGLPCMLKITGYGLTRIISIDAIGNISIRENE